MLHRHVYVCAVVSNSLRPHGLWPTRLLCPWDFPGKNTGVGCHFLLQEILPTKGLNPRLQAEALLLESRNLGSAPSHPCLKLFLQPMLGTVGVGRAEANSSNCARKQSPRNHSSMKRKLGCSLSPFVSPNKTWALEPGILGVKHHLIPC